MKTYLEADVVTKQITAPCEDCPFRRIAIKGWLADTKPEDYIYWAHTDDVIDCHTKKLPRGGHVQCAGAAIYRANTVKSPRPPNLELPADHEKVFSNAVEFLEHHYDKKLTAKKVRQLMHKAFMNRVALS